MIFRPLDIEGAYAIEPARREDARGWFARTYCAEDFAARGLAVTFPQCSASYNARRGTLRGLHFQATPHPEAKLIRCVRGAVFDVAVDIRPGSGTFGKWTSVEMSETSGTMIYIPVGCAHGFQTLRDDTELFYQISVPYRAELAGGIRWDDPDLAIGWPIDRPVMSDRDRTLPVLAEIAEAGDTCAPAGCAIS